MKRLLIVEDEQSIRELLALNLERAGFEVVTSETGEEAIDIFFNDKIGFDVAILDVMLPGMSGFDVCREIRMNNNSIGILILTAKSQETDKIHGFAIGADDYIVKPFGTNELIARIDAVYRRTPNAIKAVIDKKGLVSGNFCLDIDSRTFMKGSRQLDLTQVEFQIMELFLKNPGVALDRDTILRRVWGENYKGEVKIVDVNIRRLRMKIEDEPSNPRNILTVWGYGYRWSP